MRDGPSKTAELVCFLRAADAREAPEHRIVGDEHAELFLSPIARAALATWRVAGAIDRWAGDLSPGVGTFVLTRHRFIDDALTSAAGASPLEQVVLLGAGYDTRVYRLRAALGGARIYEVDHPATARRKREILAEHTDRLADPENVTRVEVDFRTDDLTERLVAAGFDPERPCFFVWEGVSMYLTREQVKGTLRTLRALAAPGSALAIDFWFLLDDPSLFSTVHRAGAHALHFLGEPITFSIHPEDAAALLATLGWEARDVATAEELERRYVPDGRRVSPANYVLSAART